MNCTVKARAASGLRVSTRHGILLHDQADDRRMEAQDSIGLDLLPSRSHPTFGRLLLGPGHPPHAGDGSPSPREQVRASGGVQMAKLTNHSVFPPTIAATGALGLAPTMR